MNVIKSITKVIASNFMTIVSGIFVGFLLPKIIPVTDYGFYKIFTIYFSYIGVLSLGIIDGIVLKYGGNDYESLNKKQFSNYFGWYVLINFLFAVISIIVVGFIDSIDYKFIILMLALNIIPINIFGYYQQLSQITQRFNEYSVIKIIQAVLNVLTVVLMFGLYYFDIGKSTYQTYLIGFLVSNIILLIIYLIRYRELSFNLHLDFFKSGSEVIELIKIGLPLLLSNFASTIFLTLDRQIVSFVVDVEEYATYAFAYSMLSIITVATSAVSMVIYPFFKRVDLTLLKEKYSHIVAIMIILLNAVLLVFYPLTVIVKWFLPNYINSLEIFRIILPGLVISSLITVIIHNYYKILNISSDFFKKTICALLFSIILGVSFFTFFKVKEAVSIASIISLVFWYYITAHKLNTEFMHSRKNNIYLAVVSILFVLCSVIPSVYVGLTLNLVLYVTVTVIFYKKDISVIKQIIKNKNPKL